MKNKLRVVYNSLLVSEKCLKRQLVFKCVLYSGAPGVSYVSIYKKIKDQFNLCVVFFIWREKNESVILVAKQTKTVSYRRLNNQM